MPAPPVILDLIARFERNIDAYKSGSYNETQVRREFIDPFFEAMGWDVNNTQGNAEAYKDVIHEDAVKVGGISKAPDYSFRIGGQRKFFVEAKKPSVNIKDAPTPAYQVRRYAWSAKLPLSIVTDFEEFAVYDCRIKPDQSDNASKARIKYYTWRQYAEKFDEIAGIFGKDAILKGSFDKYAESNKAKRGTAEVDSAFLKEIESWRDMLAKNIALRNTVSVRELNDCVQRTIDRIIFLRIAEDRGIEEYGSLRGLGNGQNTYARLQELFYRADDRYNSGLFHFRHERGEAEPPDNLTMALKIDDKPLKDILKRLYYPESPYEFSVLPADILGQVYEQFLGKVIRLTGDHRAVVEDKPEVKKAGGVFYTPTYIVDYIVKNTVGRLLEGKTPKKAESLRILDPACGSGSFLIGAYQHLLNWHLKWYAENNPDKHAKAKKPTLYKGAGDAWHLTTAERKRILLNNIYGVDIDSQAVEVTKLSLLLKVLEGETGESLNQQRKLFHERALPNLGGNIKCGNSLIDPDFYDGRQMSMLDDEERLRVNVFDWQAEFPEIFEAGGFDAVIGNPPYIRIQALKEWAPKEVEFYKKSYNSAQKGNYDIYVVFVEKGFSLLNKNGLLGYILPNKFLSTDYGISLRSYLAEAYALDTLIDFGHSQVFESATTYTCLLFLKSSNPNKFRYTQTEPQSIVNTELQFDTLQSESLGESPWVFGSKEANNLLCRLFDENISLLDVPALMSRGTSSGADDIFCLQQKNGQFFDVNEKVLEIEKGILRKPLYATDFSRYNCNPKNTNYIIFPYVTTSQGYEIISEKVFEEKWPKAYKYLFSNKSILEKRKQFKHWYGFSAPRNLNVHDKADILVPLLANRGLFAPVPRNSENYCLMASGGFSISILEKDNSFHPWYLLGLLNSKLLFWCLNKISNKFRSGWITCTKQYFGTLPIRVISFTNPSDNANHDLMVQLVEQMLTLNKQLPEAKTSHEHTLIQRQIDATDRQIDKLVYELYGLTPEEIAIVEGK